MNEGEINRLKKVIKKAIETAKDNLKNYPATSAVEIGKALETAIKLYYGVRGISLQTEPFNFNDAINDLAYHNDFDMMITSDMHVIRRSRNTVHSNSFSEDFTEEYVDKLLVRLVECIRAIEKEIGICILEEPERRTYIHNTAVPKKMTIKLGDGFLCHSNDELINYLFCTDFKCWNACTAKVKNNIVNDNEIIWMIALTGKESSYGWTNELQHSGKVIREEYTGDLRTILPRHRYIDKSLHKIVFDIVDDAYGKRKYVFRGIFEFDYDKSNDKDNGKDGDLYRFWNKISDEFIIDTSSTVTIYEPDC